MFGQQQDIVASFAQGRQANLETVEPMKQVFAKLVGGDCLNDVAIGRGDEADVHAQFLRAAHARERAVFQNRSSLACKGRLMSAISSRKIVPPSASSTRPGFCRNAPVNAPFSCPTIRSRAAFREWSARLMR